MSASEFLAKPSRHSQRDADTRGSAFLQQLRNLNLGVKFAALSIVPVLVLGFVLTRSLDSGVEERSLLSAKSQSQLLFSAALEGTLEGPDLNRGIGRRRRDALDRLVADQPKEGGLAALRVFDRTGRRVYTSGGGAGAPVLPPAARRALSRGKARSALTAGVRRPGKGTGLKTVSTYLPLRSGEGPPAAVEVALRYEPIRAIAAGAATKTRRLVVGGLALLYGVLLLGVGGASRAPRPPTAGS